MKKKTTKKSEIKTVMAPIYEFKVRASGIATKRPNTNEYQGIDYQLIFIDELTEK